MSIINTFNRINSSRSRDDQYVVLVGWHDFDIHPPKVILILRRNRESFMKIGCLVESGNFSVISGTSAKFFVVQKSEGLFADAFEANLLAGSCLYRNVLNVPQLADQAFIMMSLGMRFGFNLFRAAEMEAVKIRAEQYVGGRSEPSQVIAFESAFSASLPPLPIIF